VRRLERELSIIQDKIKELIKKADIIKEKIEIRDDKKQCKFRGI